MRNEATTLLKTKEVDWERTQIRSQESHENDRQSRLNTNKSKDICVGGFVVKATKLMKRKQELGIKD